MRFLKAFLAFLFVLCANALAIMEIVPRNAAECAVLLVLFSLVSAVVLCVLPANITRSGIRRAAIGFTASILAWIPMFFLINWLLGLNFALNFTIISGLIFALSTARDYYRALA